MILGSHNAWSYLPPRKWWQWLLRFTARCQRVNIARQVAEFGVQCVDLRVRFAADGVRLVHGIVEYQYTREQLEQELTRLNAWGSRVPMYVRVLLDVRTKRAYTQYQREAFWQFCNELEMLYPYLRFWCGRNLYNWNTIYTFHYAPTCEERYASVCRPKWLGDWFPLPYALLHNHRNRERGTDKDILLIDFVDIT